MRLAGWLAPEAIPRGLFTAEGALLSEMLGDGVDVCRLSIDLALAELDGFSLVRPTSKTVSVHRLLQAVERDSLSGEECERWIVWAARLFNAFAPGSPDDARTWDVWLPLAPHAQALLECAKRHVIDTLPIALMANQFGLFLHARGVYSKVEPVFRSALAIYEKALGPGHPNVATGLHNLAGLLRATNRLSDAEPLRRRSVVILLKSTLSTGHLHPNLRTTFNNYHGLLMGLSLGQEEIRKRIAELGREAGFDREDYRKVMERIFGQSL